DQRAGRRELIAERDIVDEARDVGIRLAALASAYDQLRQGWKPGEIDFTRKLPAPALDLFLDHDILGGDVQRGRLVAMNDAAVGALDGLGLDLPPFDRPQLHPRLDPALEEYMADGVRRRHDDIGAIDRVLGQRDGSDFDAKQLAHGGGEGFAVLWIGAEAADGRDVANGAGRHELRAGLPTRAE